MPTHSTPDSTRARVISMYRAGKKVAAIAGATGVSQRTIYRVLQQAGISTSRTSDPGVGNLSGGGNMMEVFFSVVRESIKDINEDNKYYLERLGQFNKVAKMLSIHLSELVGASQQLSAMEKDRIDVEVNTFDWLDAHGMFSIKTSRTMSLDRVALTDTIAAVQSMQEVLRNSRQVATIEYETVHQSARELRYFLISALNCLNEMHHGSNRSPGNEDHMEWDCNE